MNYDNLYSSKLPAMVDMPPGSMTPTRYVFSVTYTDPDTLPVDGLSDAMLDATTREGRDLALYPPEQGHEDLRNLIVQYLKSSRGLKTDIDSVFLSEGAGGAIRCILDAFIDPGDIVLVEEFTYLGTLKALLQRRASVIHIPTDDQGMDTNALERTVNSLLSQGKRPKMIYTIPVYQNPMGMTLSLDRRKHMLDISHKHGIPILENDSYADFRIDGALLPPAIMGIDDQESVMYVSAYTKLLGCGIRLGFAVVPESVMKMLANLSFGGNPSRLASMTVYEYLRKHKDEHIEAVRASLKAKRDAMLAALGENFPPECTWSKPEGGMMIWGNLPERADTWVVLDKAIEANVKYNPGPIFRANRDRSNYLRLTYSYNTPEEIHEGIAILADVFRREGLFDSY